MASLLTDIGAVLTAVMGWIVQLFTSVVSIFYTSGADGGLTFLGYILFIAFGLTIVWFVIRFIVGLVKRS